MGVIPEQMIELVLYIAFGMYTLMGLVFFIMGISAMSDVGAVGASGLYMLFFGLAMLIIGGISLLANYKHLWLVLFVVEMVNIAMFLVRRPVTQLSLDRST
jgi:hypothetical protein